jgi:hypothetical protein
MLCQGSLSTHPRIYETCVSETIHDGSRPGSYERIFLALRDAGESATDAAAAAAETYLADRPGRRGKEKIGAAERHSDFWTSEFLTALPADAYLMEPMVLALTRYRNCSPL